MDADHASRISVGRQLSVPTSAELGVTVWWTTYPDPSEIVPPSGATVRGLKRLRLFFDELINDLRVEDIRINGQAPSVTGFSAAHGGGV